MIMILAFGEIDVVYLQSSSARHVTLGHASQSRIFISILVLLWNGLGSYQKLVQKL